MVLYGKGEAASEWRKQTRLFHPQGSELAGWALGRYSYEGIDMNHNFADLNSVMWTAIELETDRSKLINHYFPIPEQYTSEEAFVRQKQTSLLYLFILSLNSLLF